MSVRMELQGLGQKNAGKVQGRQQPPLSWDVEPKSPPKGQYPVSGYPQAQHPEIPPRGGGKYPGFPSPLFPAFTRIHSGLSRRSGACLASGRLDLRRIRMDRQQELEDLENKHTGILRLLAEDTKRRNTNETEKD